LYVKKLLKFSAKSRPFSVSFKKISCEKPNIYKIGLLSLLILELVNQTITRTGKRPVNLTSNFDSSLIFNKIITNKNKIEIAPTYTIKMAIEKNSIFIQNKTIDMWTKTPIKLNKTYIGDETINKKLTSVDIKNIKKTENELKLPRDRSEINPESNRIYLLKLNQIADHQTPVFTSTISFKIKGVSLSGLVKPMKSIL